MNLPDNQENLVRSLLESSYPNKVKMILVMRNICQKELAMRLGVKPSEVSRVINGKRRTLHIRSAIARELGLSVQELFGQR